nr:MAG TPA: hemopoietic lineage transmembrane helix [Caudoviricetes sp.]
MIHLYHPTYISPRHRPKSGRGFHLSFFLSLAIRL